MVGQGPIGSSSVAASVGGDQVRRQTERVLADPLFRNSRRYSDLLKYIVDRTLEGRLDDLRERIIGIEVFGRAPDYDTSLDSTVRVVATEVRKRLAAYYSDPTRQNELRIELPPGSYVAEFRAPAQAVAGRARVRGRSVGLAAAVVLGALAVWGLLRAWRAGDVVDRFWEPVLGSPGQVLLCVSSPSGGALSPAPSVPPPAAPAPATPFAEFLAGRREQVPAAAYALRSFLTQRNRDSVVRAARDTSFSDLRSAPSILIGSYANEWTLRLGAEMPYRFRRESERGLRWIEDASNPASRAWSVDLSQPYGQITADYGVLARYLDKTTDRWMLMMAGLTSLATNAACEMSVTPDAMAALAKRLPQGWADRNLQAVLSVKLVHGAPGPVEVLALRSW